MIKPVPSPVRRWTPLLLLIGAFAIAWYTAKVLLVAFAGILGAIVLNAATGFVSRRLGIRRNRSFLIVLLSLIVLVGFAVYSIVPRVVIQASQIFDVLPKAIDNARHWLAQYDWGRTILERAPASLNLGILLQPLTRAFSTILDLLAEFLVFVVVAAYVGADPDLYEQGILTLLPEDRRGAAKRILNEVGYTLQWWLLGQLVPMVALGIATIIVLSILRIPLVFTLGLFTGLMIFIPYVGSFIAFLLTFLVTLSDDPEKVPYVAILFIAIHVAEGYLLTPLVQKRAVYLPPALTIIMQLLMATLLGFLGIALATPLTAAALVLVKLIYLGQQPQHH